MAGPDPIVDAITLARVSLLFNQPFFGNLSTRLKLVDATKWCKTAATDGRHLFYNRDFIKALTPAELEFLVSHEILHCCYDHIGRRGSRDPSIWNAANDYIVNYTLVKEKVGQMPKSGLYNDKFTDDMTSEEVYNIIMKNSTTIKISLKTLDEHLDSKGDKEDDGEGGEATVTVMNPDPTGENGPPQLTEEELESIRNELKAAMISACQTAGKVPAGVRRLIKEITDPQLDWRQLLEMHIQSAVKDDFTFVRPNKRSWGLGVILPGQLYLPTINIEVFIDASGSMTEDMLRDLLTEVKGIMSTFREFTLHLSTFDTRVYNRVKFTADNLDEIDEYDVKGGGGTSFNCCWDYMESEGIVPEKIVFFTDSYTGDGWGTDEYDTLWIIHGNSRAVAPHGTTVYYEPK